MASSMPDHFDPAAFDQWTSSSDDFESAVEFLTPKSRMSSEPIDVTPGTVVNSIVMEDIQSQESPSSDESTNDENSIPPPKTCDSNDEKYQWEPLDMKPSKALQKGMALP